MHIVKHGVADGSPADNPAGSKRYIVREVERRPEPEPCGKTRDDLKREIAEHLDYVTNLKRYGKDEVLADPTRLWDKSPFLRS